MSLQTPGTAKRLRAQPALVVSHTGVSGEVAPKAGGTQVTLATVLAVVGVEAPVGRLVLVEDIRPRKAPTTLGTCVTTRGLDLDDRV